MFILCFADFLLGLGAGLLMSAAESQGVRVNDPMAWYWRSYK